MKKHIILFIVLFHVCAIAEEGKALFDEKCVVCHMKSRPTKEMKPSFIAPPITGVMKNVKRAFGNDKQATLSFIREYTLAPNMQESKCKPKALKRFGMMPSQEKNVTPAELDKIALFLYKNYAFPKRNKGK